jgi:hypothetical protein
MGGRWSRLEGAERRPVRRHRKKQVERRPVKKTQEEAGERRPAVEGVRTRRRKK